MKEPRMEEVAKLLLEKTLSGDVVWNQTESGYDFDVKWITYTICRDEQGFQLEMSDAGESETLTWRDNGVLREIYDAAEKRSGVLSQRIEESIALLNSL